MQLSVQFQIFFQNKQQSMRIWNDSIEWHMLQLPSCVFLPNPKGQEGRRVEENTSVNVNTAMQIKTFKSDVIQRCRTFLYLGVMIVHNLRLKCRVLKLFCYTSPLNMFYCPPRGLLNIFQTLTLEGVISYSFQEDSICRQNLF